MLFVAHELERKAIERFWGRWSCSAVPIELLVVGEGQGQVEALALPRA